MADPFITAASTVSSDVSPPWRGGEESSSPRGDCTWLTPPQVARRLGIKAEKVRTWITAGELRAIDVATKRGGRPRYRVHEADLLAFELKREIKPRPTARRPRSKGQDVIKFF